MPHLPCSGPVALPVQVSSDPLRAVALVDVLLKDGPNYGGFRFIDNQFVELMLALVEAPAFDQIIAIRGKPALEAACLNELPQGGLGTDGSLFALSVGLPETDVIGELVGVAVKTLLAFLGAPYLDPLLDEPFHHKGRFICNAPDAVKHEHQQDVELFLPGQILDDLQLVTILCSDFVAGNTFLLFLMDNGPAHFVTEGAAGFPLHGDVGLVFVVVVHLFVGGNAIQCANSVFHGLSSFHLLYGQKEDASIRILCRFQGAQ